MRRFLRVSIGLALLVGGCLLLAPAPRANAAEGFNVITSPLPIKISTTPGQTVTEQLRIKNQGDQAEGIKVGLMKFGATGTSGTPDLFELGPKDTYASWVHFSPQQFTAQPGIWNSITMTIDIPSDADLGYYLAVTFSPANQPGVKDVTNLKGSAASLVLLEVKTPNEHRSLQLVDFSTDHKLYEYLPANFNIKVHNNGNIFLPPAGNIFIMKGSKTVATLDVNDAGGSVLPQSNRIFSVPWTDGFPRFVDRQVNNKPVTDSHGRVKQNLKWDFTQVNKLRFGKYTAKLLLAYDNGQEDVPLESTLTFWVIPWKLMLLLLVVLAIVGYGIYSLVRSTLGKGRGLSKYRRGRK